ncbi:unnamed protein product, partial [Porites evermanni]
MSETCEFSTLKNSLIKDRIVLGISDAKTRERLLRISDLTLEKAIEWFDLQRQQKNSQRTWQATNPGTPSANEDRLSSSKIFKCRNCGIRHGVRECPVYGKTCHNCIAKKQHHFKSMCRSLKK